MKNNHIKDRKGEIRVMNCGMSATIIDYRNCLDLSLQFEDGYIVKSTRYQKF